MQKPITIAIVAMGILSRLFGAADHEKRKEAILQHESQPASAEAFARKTRSIAFLKRAGVPTLEHLPVIEDSQSAKTRSTRQIAERLVACTISAVGGETGDRAFVRKLLSDFSAETLLSPEEQRFVDEKINDQQERVQFSWRYERSWVLLWSLGYIEKLDYPPSICDVPKLAGLIKGRSVEQLVQDAKPRQLSEVLDEADLIYRLHWALTEERVNRTVVVPTEIERGVVQERHAALNWLIGYLDQEWDDITTDT